MPKKSRKNSTIFFSNVSDWLVDIKLRIHYGEDKTKTIHLALKRNKIKKSVSILNMKQYILNNTTELHILAKHQTKTLMLFWVMQKINTRLRFWHWANRLLSQSLRRLLYYAIIHPHFDYACSDCYILT